MARTVLCANPNCWATRRAEALSQASPTASSKRLEKGALLGNWSTFSIFKPQSGQRTRYNSITTVVRNSPQGRSRTSRSVVSAGSAILRPHPEQMSRRFPRFRLTHSFRVLAFSSISCWKTAYPGQPRILLQSFCLNPPVYRIHSLHETHAGAGPARFLLRADFSLSDLEIAKITKWAN